MSDKCIINFDVVGYPTEHASPSLTALYGVNICAEQGKQQVKQFMAPFSQTFGSQRHFQTIQSECADGGGDMQVAKDRWVAYQQVVEQCIVNLTVIGVRSDPLAELNGVDILSKWGKGRVKRFMKPYDITFGTKQDFQDLKFACEIEGGGEMEIANGKWLTYKPALEVDNG